MQKKNKLYKSFIKHPTEQNKSAFISYRNGFSKLKTAAKKSYYNNLFSEYNCCDLLIVFVVLFFASNIFLFW